MLTFSALSLPVLVVDKHLNKKSNLFAVMIHIYGDDEKNSIIGHCYDIYLLIFEVVYVQIMHKYEEFRL